MGNSPIRQIGRQLARAGMGIGLLLLLGACNAPPMYDPRAREFLTGQGVASSTILKLEERKPLSAEEVAILTRYNDVPTLHLLGANPSTTREILTRLAQHSVQDVRWGAATNPNAPIELLLKLRTPGKYSTVNGLPGQKFCIAGSGNTRDVPLEGGRLV